MSVLGAKEDEELLSVLLQLVQVRAPPSTPALNPSPLVAQQSSCPHCAGERCHPPGNEAQRLTVRALWSPKTPCVPMRAQALRYESADVSRLSRFLVQRAAANPTFAIMLHWYLATGAPATHANASSLSIHILD